MNRFDQQLAIGRFWELAVNGYLQARGYRTAALYMASDGDAPALVGTFGKLILPDIVAERNERAAFFEVKFKAATTYYRKAGRMTTGIPIRHRDAYKVVKKSFDCPVYIVFIHEKENTVRYGELDALKVSHEYTGARMGKGGEVFYCYDNLTHIMTADALRQFAPAGRENRPTPHTHAIREGIRL